MVLSMLFGVPVGQNGWLPHLGAGMEIVLWVPMGILSLITFLDLGKGLIHNVQYLIFYLWFIYLIPQMTAFIFLLDTNWTFVLSIIFIILAQIFITVAENAAGNMGNGGPSVHFIFACQLYEYFFGALFFINVQINALFWFLLFIQSFWLIFRNSGLGLDIVIWSYYKVIQPKLRDWGVSYLQNITFESSRKRLYQQSRMAVQYTICDFTVLIGIPLQYFMNTYNMTSLDQLITYAGYFQMNLCQHDSGELYTRFLIVAGVKLVFHIVAHTLLWYKVRSYNMQSKEYGLHWNLLCLFTEILALFYPDYLVRHEAIL